ncbi:MAG: hypothetical protein J1D87_06285 [Lachnospiraceae bacterium]|nr:hypothetical protein [Lachnospiraceae bacterium]
MLTRRTKGIIAIIVVVAINIIVSCARNSNTISDTNDTQEESSVGEESNIHEEMPDDETDTALSNTSESLTMDMIITLFNEGVLGDTDFFTYDNWEREDLIDGALNDTYSFYIYYNDEEYQVGLSYSIEDNELVEVYLSRISDGERCLLYSTDERYHTVDSIEEFLNTKTQISDWLTIELPEGYTLSEYDANVGIGWGGAYIEPQAYDVQGDDTYGNYVIDWTMSGCIGRLYVEPDDFLFKNGMLTEKQIRLWNHTSEEKVTTLAELDKPAILYHINHDLYTAGDIGRLEEQGISITPEDTTSDYWYIFFAEEGESEAFYLALDQRQFTRAEAIDIAKTVKFTQSQSDENVMKAVPTEIFDKPVNDLDGVSMKVTSASPTFASLEILNSTDLQIRYGDYYDLQVFQNGEWYSLSYLIDDWGFTAIGYDTIKNVPSEFGINWELFHGTLSAGDYRIVKNISDRKENGDFTTYYLAAEFRID